MDAFEEKLEPGTEREFIINMDEIADLRANHPKPAFYYTSETQHRLIFHDTDSVTIRAMKSVFDVDILRGMDSDLAFLRMMMHRRHVFEHNSGVADERYVRESGDTAACEGVLIRENQANAHRLIGALARIFDNFDKDFHEIFPPTTEPIEYYCRRKESAGVQRL